MIKQVTLFLICITFISCSSIEKEGGEKKELSFLSYVISPNSHDSRIFDVTLIFKGGKSGKSFFKYTKEWAGNDYEKDFTDFKVLTKYAEIKSRKGHPKNISKVITHKPSEKITIKYSVKSAIKNINGNYKAMIMPEYFHMIGQSFLFVPDEENNEKQYSISLSFKGFSKKYKFANSFFAQKSSGLFQSKIDDFLYGVFVGGDFRVKKMKVKGKPLFVAVRGNWKFKDDVLYKAVYSIVSYQRNFFNDHKFPQFLVTMVPNGLSCCSAGGTGLTNSFASFFPEDAKMDEHAKFLLSHELFHTWNGRRITRKQPEELVYWFSEGFTDYYSRLLLLRAGEITLEQFIDDYNEILYKYYTSDVINEPNEKILTDFWKNREVEKLPYQRGNILARLWNAKIKTASEGESSLDDVVFDFFEESQAKGTKVSKKYFVRIAGKYFKGGFLSDIDKYIEHGETLIPGENDLGPCVKRRKIFYGKFNHGYDSQKTYKHSVITGLDSKSNAYKAGLRNRDKLLGRKIVFPPVKKSWIQTYRKGVVTKISFLPTTGKSRKAFAFELDKKIYIKNPRACLKWFM